MSYSKFYQTLNIKMAPPILSNLLYSMTVEISHVYVEANGGVHGWSRNLSELPYELFDPDKSVICFMSLPL